jgi:hypothetical protein
LKACWRYSERNVPDYFVTIAKDHQQLGDHFRAGCGRGHKIRGTRITN